MKRELEIGDRVPGVTLGRLAFNRIKRVSLLQVCKGQSVVIVGVPGAFTPSCSKIHIPGYVAQAEKLKQAGIDQVVCVAPNDPWTLAVWARRLDPTAKLLFLSDRNGEFGESTGLTFTDNENFLGRTLRRFVLMAVDGVVQRLDVEQNMIDITCTSAEGMVDTVKGADLARGIIDAA